MEWTCRECGNSVGAADIVFVITIGWVGLDGDTGICPICNGAPSHDAQHDLIPSSRARIEQSRRLIAMTQDTVRKARLH